MTDELKNLICNYIGIPYFESSFTGNDMVAAKNVMVEKGEWKGFIIYCSNLSSGVVRIGYVEISAHTFIAGLMQPTNFFELMGRALEEEVIGIT